MSGRGKSRNRALRPGAKSGDGGSRRPPRDRGAPPGKPRHRSLPAVLALVLLGAFFATVFTSLVGSPSEAARLDAVVARSAGENDLDPALVHAVIECESSGRPEAVSRAGAVGLMQVMPGTAAAVCEDLGLPAPAKRDLFDPEINVRIGAHYLAKMLRLFDDPHLALGAYNAGPGNVRRWMAKRPGCPGADVIRAEGFPETRAYVARVMESWKSRKKIAARTDTE